VFSKITVAIVGMGVIFLAASQLLGYIVLLGLFFLLFRGYPFRLPTMASIKSYTYFTMPLFLTILMIQFTVSLDKTIIGYYWGFEAVGFYTVPQSIVYLMYMVASALTAILLPSLSKKYAEGDIDYVNRTVILAEKYIFLILTPVIVMVMIYAEVIIVSLFSEIFLPAVDIFRILAFVIYLRAINSPYSTKLVSTGYVKLVFVGSLFFYIPHLILDFVFVPEIFLGIKMLGLGGKGAALASLTGVFLGSIAVRYFNYKTTGIGLNYRVILYFFSGASMASVLVILNIVFNINNLFVAILSSTLGLIYYFLILHVLKEFGRNEINFFIDIINPTKMKDYIKEEIS
jgi:O-antigen/teichoic acid export membrane protein